MHFRSEQFQWQEGSKTYVAEASELRLQPGRVPVVVSINGNEFAHSSTDRDASDEDIAGWRYKPTPETLAKSPVFSGTSVLIVND